MHPLPPRRRVPLPILPTHSGPTTMNQHAKLLGLSIALAFAAAQAQGATYTFTGSPTGMQQSNAPVATYDTIAFNTTGGYFAMPASFANPYVDMSQGNLLVSNGYNRQTTTLTGAFTGGGSWGFTSLASWCTQDFIFQGDMTAYSGAIFMSDYGNDELILGNNASSGSVGGNSNIVMFGGTSLASSTVALGVITDGVLNNVSGTGALTTNVLVYNYASDAAYTALSVGNSSITVRDLLDVRGSADYVIANAISGTGGLTMESRGALTLIGANSYSGQTTVSAGKLQIGNGSASGDIGSGAVSVATGATLEFNRTGTLDYKANARMRNVAGSGDIVLDGGVKLFNYTGSGLGFADADSWNNFSGQLIIKGDSEFQTIRNGRTAMGTAQVILGDATTSGKLSQIEGNWTWTNNIRLDGSANEIINNAAVGSGGRYNKLQGVISGDGNVTFKDSTGAFSDGNLGFILTGANTLNGTITVDTFVRVGGVTGDDTTTPAGAGGTLGNASVVINSGKRLTFSRSDTHTVANSISGAGSVHIGSTGITGSNTQVVTLSGNNSYTGGTELLTGTLAVDSLARLGTRAAPGDNTGYLAIKNGATFQYTGTGESTARRLYIDNGAATIEVTDAGATLDWDDDNNSLKNQNFTKTGAGTLILRDAFSGSATMTVNGGTLELTNVNTYAGATNVDAGTLVVDGSIAASSLTAVDAGAKLMGTGTIGATDVYGTLAPGHSIGTLTILGNLKLLGAAEFEINRDSSPNADLAAVTGNLAYGGTLTVSQIEGSSALQWGDTFNLFDWTGTRSDTFSSVTLPALTGGLVWQNDLLTLGSITVVPEPASVLGLSLVLSSALLFRRRNG